MKVSRNFSIFVQYLLDEWVPPRIRDSKVFMYLPMKLVLRDTVDDFLSFKDNVFSMTQEQFSNVYARTSHVQELQGETDLNEKCESEILKTVKGAKVLEVGCGRGYLAGKLAKNNKVTACDIYISESMRARYPEIKFKSANIEALPFKDGEFDIVVTTHTLEHVQDLSKALSEVRRVAKSKLIIVVPRQRPYKYNFSLHTQFFPYRWSLESQFGAGENTVIKKLGDWYYLEDIN